MVNIDQISVPERFHDQRFLTRQRNHVDQRSRRSMPDRTGVEYETAIGRIMGLFNALSVVKGSGNITMTISNGSCSFSGNFSVYDQRDQHRLLELLHEIDVLGFQLAHTMPGSFQTTFSFNQRSFIVENGREIEVR